MVNTATVNSKALTTPTMLHQLLLLLSVALNLLPRRLLHLRLRIHHLLPTPKLPLLPLPRLPQQRLPLVLNLLPSTIAQAVIRMLQAAMAPPLERTIAASPNRVFIKRPTKSNLTGPMLSATKTPTDNIKTLCSKKAPLLSLMALQVPLHRNFARAAISAKAPHQRTLTTF